MLTSLGASGSFIYSDFSTSAGLQLNGSTARTGNVLRLTSTLPAGQSGSAFTSALTPLGSGNSFSTYFQFRITGNSSGGDGDGPGGDGLVFALQTASSSALGTAGGELGYGGIGQSLGIEFDTFSNRFGSNDPDGNHVGIDLNGSVVSVATSSAALRFNDGSVWNAWVDYDGANDLLEVRWALADSRPAAAQLMATLDLELVLGQNAAYPGFTSSTGAATANHDLLSWQFEDSFRPIGVVPEPSSVLFSLGIVGVIFGRRRLREPDVTS